VSTDPTSAVAASATDSDSVARQSLLPITLSVAAAVLILDQLTKWLAVAYLEGKPPVEVIGSVLKFTFVRNPGAAFSLGGGYTIIFSLLAAAVAIVIVRTARSLGSKAWAIALGGLLGGALGNLLDRIFRDPGFLRGHVVDFIQLPYWAIFNVADMAVVCSAILIVILTLRGIPLRGGTQ
jgi:signal peptidase II